MIDLSKALPIRIAGMFIDSEILTNYLPPEFKYVSLGYSNVEFKTTLTLSPHDKKKVNSANRCFILLNFGKQFLRHTNLVLHIPR